MQQQDNRFLELLQRWSDGDFSRADERELHGLAATDAFRQEALEGFLAAPESDHAARLASLRARLRTQTGEQRFTLPQLLMAVAAGMALLIGVVVFWPSTSTPQLLEIAQTQPVEPQSIPETAENIAQVNTRVDPQVSAGPTVKKMPEAQADRRAEPEQDAEVVTFAVSDDKASTTPNAAERNAKPQATLPSPATNNPPAPWNAIPPGKATDQVVSASRTKARAPTSPGAADTLWNKTDTQGEAAKKEVVIPAETTPANGWEAFREYLRQGARLTPEARNNNISGTVRVQFSVNANGEPQNFLFLRRLGYGCDQEATRLIQNWEWIRGKNPNVTVDVPFVR